jgi:uncharacterized protein YegP (UPF0339 family)
VKPYKIVTQESYNPADRWMFWIVAPNNATVAKSCRWYTTRRGAERAAVKLLNAWRSNGIEVVPR